MGWIAEAVGDYDGMPGDSSGNEVRRCAWWNYASSFPGAEMAVYRTGDEGVRDAMMEAAVEIAKNDRIGYEMSGRRVTSFDAFEAIGWDASRIADVGTCFIDCSEMMACCVNFALGYAAMGSDTWTGNIGSRLRSLGFDELGWTADTDLLRPGDILVAHNWSTGQGHTGMYIGNDEDGEFYMSISWNDQFAGIPAWECIYHGWKNAKEANEKCDRILDKLESLQVSGASVDYDRIKRDVEDVQKSLRMVAE